MTGTKTRTKTFLTSAIATGSLALCLTVAGCNGCNSSSAPIVDDSAASNPNSPDPAMANLASGTTGNGGTQVLGQTSSYTPQQSSESYGQQAPAPIVQGGDYAYNQPDTTQSYDSGYQQGEAEQQAVDATQAPPELPEYSQPPDPGPGYMWTPGYWAYAPTGYYWVPGTWVEPPYYGALWTPPYWGYYGNRYYFHHGYWGPHVGFYGGINYGFGYIGFGFFGGYWRGHDFYYNRAVTNVGPHITNVYNRTVIVNNVHYGPQPTTRVSYNGGPHGIDVRPRPAEMAAMHESHAAPVPAQRQLVQQAATNREQFYNQNHGRPAQPVLAPRETGPAHIAGERPAAPAERGGFNPGAQPRPGVVDAHNPAQPQRVVEPQRGPEPQRAPQVQQPRPNEPQRNPQVQPEQQRQQEQRNFDAQHQAQPMRAPAQPMRTPSQPQHTEAPRPEPQAAPRPAPAPHEAPRPAEAPHAAPAPHPAAAPHPAPAPHPGGGEHPRGR